MRCWLMIPEAVMFIISAREDRMAESVERIGIEMGIGAEGLDVSACWKWVVETPA